MIGIFGFLLFFLQLWQFAMPNRTMLTEPANQVALFKAIQANFPLQIGNKLYRVEKKLVTWYEAGHLCRSLGGNLLNIESSGEMDALLAAIPNDKYWTSGNCLAGNRDFVSITTGEAVKYFRWHKGEPNNFKGNENCISVEYKLYNDLICSGLINFICEAKIMY